MKKYLIIAGVNGAGKTTLYHTNDFYHILPRVNIDEIVREFGSWKNSDDVFKAGKIAVRMIKDFFEKEESFNQETTLCGHSILNNINKAKRLGYEIELCYVGLASVDLAIKRVEQRVKDGGHGIPAEDIEKRYYESLNNLKKVIPICNRVTIYDNTKSLRRISVLIEGKCAYKTDDIPEWCASIVE